MDIALGVYKSQLFLAQKCKKVFFFVKGVPKIIRMIFFHKKCPPPVQGRAKRKKFNLKHFILLQGIYPCSFDCMDESYIVLAIIQLSSPSTNLKLFSKPIICIYCIELQKVANFYHFKFVNSPAHDD